MMEPVLGFAGISLGNNPVCYIVALMFLTSTYLLLGKTGAPVGTEETFHTTGPHTATVRGGCPCFSRFPVVSVQPSTRPPFLYFPLYPKADSCSFTSQSECSISKYV